MNSLALYNKKRNFKKSKEPKGKRFSSNTNNLKFVIQEHHASHLHYDFRLEWKGVLKSWAIPKGPEMDTKIKRLAVEVEDHPLEYGSFEGEIPKGEYGGGYVMIWDEGNWLPEGNVEESLKKGKLEFSLNGTRLSGKWILIRTRRIAKKPNWLLIYRGENPQEILETNDNLEKDKFQENLLTKRLEKFEFIKPQLALLVSDPPDGSEWIHEIKFDGYRIQIHIVKYKCKLFTRSGLDWTKKYIKFARRINSLKLEDCILDGELVFVDDDNKMDFQGLQTAQKNENEQLRLCFYAFDLLSYKNSDTRGRELFKRKILLEQHFEKSQNSFFKISEQFKADSSDLLKAACQLGLEGLISKNRESTYSSGRNSHWVKAKCGASQEMVIAGFTEPTGNRSGFGALLLGYFNSHEELIYAGKVGTGFDDQTLISLFKKIKKLEIEKSIFQKPPVIENVHWVKPELVAEIQFAQWTNDKKLRDPVFKGLRSDKPAKLVKMETPNEEQNAQTACSSLDSSLVSHPDKVLFSGSGITKLEVAHYYLTVSNLIAPYLFERRASFLKCPKGTSGECFLQRHLPIKAEGLKAVDGKNPESSYFFLSEPLGLLSFVQNNGIELHCSNSRVSYEGFADQFIIDFDPDDSVDWSTVIESAYDLKNILDQLNLKSFVKLSGGKGIHVHIPLLPIYSFDQIKSFSEAVCKQLKSMKPELFLTELSKVKRKNKILLDYYRNSENATAVVPYSLRARTVDSIAMPIEWHELRKIKSPTFFTMKNALEKIQNRERDPWLDFERTKQRIQILEEPAVRK